MQLWTTASPITFFRDIRSICNYLVTSQMIWIEDVIHYSHHNTWEADYHKHTNEYHEACHLLLNDIRYRIGRQNNQGTINSIQIYGREV